jgi:hypothetical protein
MQYHHTQTGGFHYFLYSAAVVLAAVAWLFAGKLGVAPLLSGVALLLAASGWIFQCMTVRDEGDQMAICYSPLEIAFKRIHYSQIRSAEKSRSSILDGWGIHWVPGRGTTYNVWGFDCVELEVGNRRIRIGSDDVDNLVAFLRSKIE